MNVAEAAERLQWLNSALASGDREAAQETLDCFIDKVISDYLHNDLHDAPRVMAMLSIGLKAFRA